MDVAGAENGPCMRATESNLTSIESAVVLPACLPLAGHNKGNSAQIVGFLYLSDFDPYVHQRLREFQYQGMGS